MKIMFDIPTNLLCTLKKYNGSYSLFKTHFSFTQTNKCYQFHKELSFNDAIPYESHWGVCYPPKMGQPIFVAQI